MDANVILGWVSTSKKLVERRSLSRISFPVLTEDRSMVALAVESSGLGAVTIWASNEVNWPRTLLTIRCRAMKPMVEWTGSRSQVPAM